jgi:polar amino acid transport system permease protein
MLGSSIVSAISAEELTAITNTLQSTTFRAFEFYFVATAFYLLMAVGARLLLHAIYWTVFERGRPIERVWSR